MSFIYFCGGKGVNGRRWWEVWLFIEVTWYVGDSNGDG